MRSLSIAVNADNRFVLDKYMYLQWFKGEAKLKSFLLEIEIDPDVEQVI